MFTQTEPSFFHRAANTYTWDEGGERFEEKEATDERWEDPNIHADGKQDTGNTGKSHYREAHRGYKELILYLLLMKNRLKYFRNSFLSILWGPDSASAAHDLTM